MIRHFYFYSSSLLRRQIAISFHCCSATSTQQKETERTTSSSNSSSLFVCIICNHDDLAIENTENERARDRVAQNGVHTGTEFSIFFNFFKLPAFVFVHNVNVALHSGQKHLYSAHREERTSSSLVLLFKITYCARFNKQ